MSKLPVYFYSNARATSSIDKAWTISSSETKALCTIPTEFGGPGGEFSPEDLFLQAAINCFIGTFKVLAKGSKISFAEVAVNGTLVVDKNIEGKTCMKSINLDIQIKDADRVDRVESIVAKTIRDGFILNSIKCDLSYSLQNTHLQQSMI